MGFLMEIYQYRDVREHEYKFAGNFGKKGEVRGVREKPTPKQMELVNRLNKAKRIRRTIGLNFDENDYWITLTYKKDTRRTMQQVKDDTKSFLDKMRRRYKKLGIQLKWMRVIEIGKHGGLHVHVLLNRVQDTDLMVKECWEHGHPFFVSVYAEGNCEQLASYMAKLPPEEDEKNPEIQREDRMKEATKDNYSFSTSRNLIRPEPVETHRYTRRTMERVIRNGPKATPGYQIAKDSIRIGVNRFTGWSYMYFTEHKIEVNKRKRRI